MEPIVHTSANAELSADNFTQAFSVQLLNFCFPLSGANRVAGRFRQNTQHPFHRHANYFFFLVMAPKYHGTAVRRVSLMI